MSPAPAAALLGALTAAALLAHRTAAPAAIALVLLVVCLRAGTRRRWVYIAGALLTSGSVLVLSPFLQSAGSHVLWTGPIVPVLGSLDVTREELAMAAMQALDRVADVKTRYGGRFVQAIGGLQGSLSARRDWFYFVNGVEADRSAAELRLRPGDVEWWDLRTWANGQMSVPVVVGAWPKPVEGNVLVVAGDLGARKAASALARSLHAQGGRGRHRVLVVSRPVVFHGERNAAGKVVFTISTADAMRLARNPKLARFRYEGLP